MFFRTCWRITGPIIHTRAQSVHTFEKGTVRLFVYRCGLSVGRNYDEIEKTSLFTFDLGDNGENLGKVIGGLKWLAGMGIQTDRARAEGCTRRNGSS